MHLEAAASIAVPFSGVVVGLIVFRLLRQYRVPPVVVFLSVGIVLRVAFRAILDPASLLMMTRPFTNSCLCLVGFVIGSHLNAEATAHVGLDFVAYVVLLFVTTYAIVHIAATFLFPSLHVFARLTASIALERSSPEALAGVNEAKSAGPFTTSTILTAAAMDSVAVIAFTIAAASLGADSAFVAVLRTAAATFFAWGVGCLVVYFVGLQWQRPAWAAVALVAALLLCNQFMHIELIAAAIGVGTWANYHAPHPITALAEHHEVAIHAVLFVLAGCRVDVLAFSPAAMGGALVLYAARMGGLYVGAGIGSAAVGWAFFHGRCLGLVTQIAIALALVVRMEELFPQSASLAMATMGAVLLALFSGPLALQVALRWAGETASSKREDGGMSPAPGEPPSRGEPA